MVTVGLYVELQAKPGKEEEEVANFSARRCRSFSGRTRAQPGSRYA